MKNKINSYIFILGTIIAVTLSACKTDKDDVKKPSDENEEELITTVEVHFTERGNASNHFHSKWVDTDGDGGINPIIDTILLDTNKIYDVYLEVLNESVTPTVNITEEIEAEDDEHIFCFHTTDANIVINRTDSDGTFEVGLKSEWITNLNSIQSDVTIQLKHQPGIKNGTCDVGETDIEIIFPLIVK